MGQAVDIVNDIMKNENNYEEFGLTVPERIREWEQFNLLVGENGSGKSRMLQMIKHNAQEKCIVFYLDFADYEHSTYRLEESLSDTEKNPLAGKLASGTEIEKEIFLDFLAHLKTQILSIFNVLPCMQNNDLVYTRDKARDILNKLNPSVQNILHREIIIEEDNIYLCKGHRKETVESEWEFLSPGEQNILFAILAVFFIRLENKPCILLIDELESHLHPDAQVKLYELLKQVLEDCNIDHCTCIASHSIFLLPLFDIQELVYMNNSQMQKINGGLYQQIYDNLTGEGPKKKGSLSEFLFSVSAWQYAEYLAECFLDPTTVDIAQSNDEQALQFVKILEGLYDQNKIINVLDFGSGSGRIGRCIELMLKNNEDISKLTSKLKYNVYDLNKISFDWAKNIAWADRPFVSKDDIITSGKKFDIIILYNVLHEIGVDEWVKELKFIFDLLSKDGLLLFGEREVLSVGEKPYGKSGYLVLGKDELGELFPNSDIHEVILPEKMRTATICFAVKKPSAKAGYPKKENVKNALFSLQRNTKSKIRDRDKNGLGERAQSRKCAFYFQQYVNVEEAIEILSQTRKKTVSDSFNRILKDEIAASLNNVNSVPAESSLSSFLPEEKQESANIGVG